MARNPSFHADLLAFLIGPAGIANGDFENSRAPFGELDRDFRLDLEAAADERYAFQQFRADHFVARFHVRQVEVGDDVAHQREEAVADLMPEEEHAPVIAREETRAKHSVRRLLREKP